MNEVTIEYDDAQVIEPVGFDFGFTRRRFVQILGAGIVIAAAASDAFTQERRGRGGRGGFGRQSAPVPLEARLHIGNDGTISVLTGKVEAGQGARTELTQAAAEELGVPLSQVTLIMADTQIAPDDGITAGSRSTPSTVPAIRQACAAARELLHQWIAKHQPIHGNVTYGDLARSKDPALLKAAPADVQVRKVAEWKILGQAALRPNARDIVTGKHAYPSDVIRPGMLYAKVLRARSYGAKMTSVDVAPAKAMDQVVTVQDGAFVAAAAPTTRQAKQAIAAIEKTAKWEEVKAPASEKLFDYLREHAEVPKNPFADVMEKSARTLKATYDVSYIQHAPLEPRAAVAEWENAKVTIWTATQNPFGVRREVAGAFHIPEENVRVIVPDFGGGFGGKHTGETAVEAARIAQAAGKPVAVRWTREEEFRFAYFRPAGVIPIEASLDENGAISSWHQVNINSGPSAVESPYKIEKAKGETVRSNPPLRHGSYRALAATANNFARESAMDELAALAKIDPLQFRIKHLGNDRLRAVLVEAADKFGWESAWKNRSERVGVGLACGTEKGSYVAACVRVKLATDGKSYAVEKVTQAFECGAILNPHNLYSQVSGAIIMGLGGAMREQIEFKDGKVTNASFYQYQVPRFADLPPLPQLEIHLVNRPDLPSAGAGETPIIAIAPAIANAICHATNRRVRQMPIALA